MSLLLLAFRNVAMHLCGARFIREISFNDQHIRVLAFEKADGKDMWALWCAKQNREACVCMESGQVVALNTRLVGRNETPAAWVPMEFKDTGAKYQMCLTIGGMPWVIEGDLSSIK